MISHVDIAARPLTPFAELYGDAEMTRVDEHVRRLAGVLRGHVVWNVNSTARGGGVAELLRSIVAYARGAGVDCRWIVIGGDAEFFRLTKGLHNAIHGSGPPELALEAPQRELYERTASENLADVLALVRPDDVVILHDPQTAGLCDALVRSGVHVVWRCHIGRDVPNELTERAWRFLAPYVRGAATRVFTRRAYVPAALADLPYAIIPPTIDPASPKNQAMRDDVARAILATTGLVEGPPPDGVTPEFRQEDGSLSLVRRSADVLGLGRAPAWDVPLVVQVSRWDRLKDPIGVMHGFARVAEAGAEASLVLAGPTVRAVADDPEGGEVLDETIAAWRELPHGIRQRVRIACLPMADAQENAAITNALQRHAAVVVQKSLEEGFGLTVTEAMWKGRPVVASRVGGLQDQIEDGTSGLLVDDPRDPGQLAAALSRLLSDGVFARRLGESAHRRVRDRFLNLQSLYAYADLIAAVASAGTAPPGEPAAPGAAAVDRGAEHRTG